MLLYIMAIRQLNLKQVHISLTYTASINNIPVENPTLSYVSGNTEVATVSDTGLLTLLSSR